MVRASSFCAGLVLLLSGCGGSGDNSVTVETVEDNLTVEDRSTVEGASIADLPVELQGSWVSGTCIAEQDQSLSETMVFSGSTLTRSLIRHTASTDCSDRFTISRNFVANVAVSGGTTYTDTGVIRDISITYTHAYVTASRETKAELQLQGTPLQDIFSPQGITDLNNIPITSFIDNEIVHSIYQLDGDDLRIGSVSAQDGGSDSSQRPDVFTGAKFTRAVVEPGCAVSGSANRKVSVLLVGNSLMNGVQPNLERLLACSGYASDIATSNPGGNWLHQHLENPRTINLIAQGFDLTLVQEQSRSIATHVPPYDIINTLKGKIEAAGSVMGFYQTWGYQNREVDLTEEILYGYESLAAAFNAPIAHVGRAWDTFYTSHHESPPFSLYRDYAHSTPQGKALVAFVLYAYLTGESPINLSSLSLAEEEALELQRVAWLTYQSHL